MAKYSQASETIEQLINDISNDLGLIHYGVDFQPLCVSKAKEVCKIVKANELAEYASERENLVFVVCYEDAFDLVDEKTQYMWLRMEMEKIVYDTEKDKMSIGCPQITVPVGFYEKYKEAAVDSALLGQYTIAQIEDKKREEAEQKRAERAAKKKNKK
jgi:hypothetical protein